MKLLLILFITLLTTHAFSQTKQNPADFLPKGFVVVKKIEGDLNRDGLNDCVLIIKGTDKLQIITDENQRQTDRNRRGIIVLMNKKGPYEVVSKNYNCFSSENEDGGVYFAPELSVEITNGNLIMHFGHGRYGYRKYTFRFQQSDFELIGYDQAEKSSIESDWVTFDETSINLLTKKKLIKKVIKVTANGKELYQQQWKHLTSTQLLRLSAINDFDVLVTDSMCKEK